MLAGAGPVETALFVVAADEGWKPQSTEHLQILDLLGVGHGVVAITKTDVADRDQLAATREEVVAQLANTTLRGAPIVDVSVKDEAGLERLRETLLDVLEHKRRPRHDTRPRPRGARACAIKRAGTG